MLAVKIYLLIINLFTNLSDMTLVYKLEGSIQLHNQYMAVLILHFEMKIPFLAAYSETMIK